MSRTFSGSISHYLASSTAAPTLNGAGPFTMACWVKPTTLSGFTSCFSIARSTGVEIVRLLFNDASIWFQAVSGSASTAQSGSISTGTWHHVGYVKAGAASHTAYNNGTAGTEQTTSVTLNAINWVSTGVTAYGVSDLIYPFNGAVAWPAIWNVALSGAEMQALADGAYPGHIRPSALKWFSWHSGDSAGGEVDIIGRGDLSETGTVGVGDSPLLTPAWPLNVSRDVGGGGGGFQPAWAARSTVTIAGGAMA